MSARHPADYWGLLREAEQLRETSPQRSLRMVVEIRQAAASLDRFEVGEQDWLALQAEVWTVLAGAYRSLADLEQAEAALNVALAFLDSAWPRSSSSPAHARLACRAAYLRCDQGRMEEALTLIDDALEVYHRLAAPAWVSALVDRGVLLTRAGRPEEAIAAFEKALDSPSIGQQPRVFSAAIHNLSLLLQQTARTRAETREALRWLQLAVHLHQDGSSKLDLHKLQGVLGLTAFKLGAVEQSIEYLWLAHEGFRQLGAIREQAGALLEIAAVETSRGATRIVKQLAGRLFSILRHPALRRDGAAALLVFARAAQNERASPELIRQARARLSRWDELI